jgi:hypothetical protein
MRGGRERQREGGRLSLSRCLDLSTDVDGGKRGRRQDLEAQRQGQEGRETPAHALHAQVIPFHVLPPPWQAGFFRPHVWAVQGQVCARVPAQYVAADVVALFRVAARLAGWIERLLPERCPPAVVGVGRRAHLHLAGGIERKEALHVRIERREVAIGHPWGEARAQLNRWMETFTAISHYLMQVMHVCMPAHTHMWDAVCMLWCGTNLCCTPYTHTHTHTPCPTT